MNLRRHFWKIRYQPRCFSIVIGNIHLGGTGKTPVVMSLARQLAGKIAVLSRGYRGECELTGAKVDPEHEQAARLYGDEPVQIALAGTADVYVGANRKRIFQQWIEPKKYDTVIMDDGFQHLNVRAQLQLVLFPVREMNWGRYTLPMGQLREPVNAIGSSDAILLTHWQSSFETIESTRAWLGQRFPNLPLFDVKLYSSGFFLSNSIETEIKDKKLVAFCGLANPGSFRECLKDHPRISLVSPFRDHHRYHENDIQRLVNYKNKLGAEGFVTTEKDWVKVGSRLGSLQEKVYVLRSECEIESSFWPFLESKRGNIDATAD